MQHVENELDITLEKLTQTNTKLGEKEKALNLKRRIQQFDSYLVLKIYSK